MSVAIQKLQGVESVNVSLNKGLAVIKLKPGNALRMEQIREAVMRNGFSPKEANVTALGKVLSAGAKLQFSLLGVDEVYELSIDPQERKISEEIKREVGKILLIDGVIPASRPPKDTKAPLLIRLKAVKQSTR